MLRSAVCSVLVIALFAIVGSATEITNVGWDPDMNVIHITLDPWPGNWDGWRMYVSGQQIPMEGGICEPVIRPDAPLSQPPIGLIVGALPWVTELDAVDFRFLAVWSG
jgi:hypothetical protein